MNLSVIICTYNRAESLRRTLQSCCDLVIPEGVKWELLIVDNNSSDHTKQACEPFTGKLPLCYIFEPQQGLSNARNRGVREAKGELILFTDDDVDVDSQWLASLVGAARRELRADFFGGKILPQWETQPPSWVDENASLLAGITMHFDKGVQSRYLDSHESLFFGANMAFRRKLFDDLQPFDPKLGYNGKDLTPHEETVFMRRLLQQGHRGYYVATAIVHHLNPNNRATETFVRRWHKGSGTTEVRRSGLGNMTHAWFGTPRHLWRRLVETAGRYALTRYTRPSGVWLRYEIVMAETWGMICEYRRQQRLKKKSVVSSQY